MQGIIDSLKCLFENFQKILNPFCNEGWNFHKNSNLILNKGYIFEKILTLIPNKV